MPERMLAGNTLRIIKQGHRGFTLLNHKPIKISYMEACRGCYHSMVKKFFLFLLAVVVAAATPTAIAKDKKGGVNDYNIEGAGTGTQGTYLVKVTVITKDKKVSDDAIKRAAVHGVLFRGFTDTTVRRTQKPLAGSIANEGQHQDFYNDFFNDGGNATSFANIVEGSRSMKKVDKMYHTSAVVNVNKESLHRYLKDAGIVKGLNSIF